MLKQLTSNASSDVQTSNTISKRKQLLRSPEIIRRYKSLESSSKTRKKLLSIIHESTTKKRHQGTLSFSTKIEQKPPLANSQDFFVLPQLDFRYIFTATDYHSPSTSVSWRVLYEPRIIFIPAAATSSPIRGDTRTRGPPISARYDTIGSASVRTGAENTGV